MSPRWRRRAWIALGGVTVLNGLTFFAYTVPKRLAERNLAARVATLRTEVERDRATVARLRQRNETVQANADDTTRFYQSLGTRSALLAVLEELQRMSRELGLRVGHRGYEPNPVKGLPLTRYTIAMPVTGTYSQLTGFLDRVEGSSHFLTVDQVNLRKRGAGGGADLDVTLSAYVRSELRGPGGT